jgi:hypothetical protein
MYKTKIFTIGAILLALVIITGNIGLACGTKSAQPPSATEPTTVPPAPPQPLATPPVIPANYTTYQDKSGLFSISYPSDWEPSLSNMTGIQQNVQETISSIKSGLPVKAFSVIFFAGKPSKGTYEPYVNISVEPVPAGVATIEQVVESEVLAARTAYKDFRELSGIKTTVGGREAAIIEWEGTIPVENYTMYFFQQYILTDKAIWGVTCGSRRENSTQWKNDFDTIVRSLRISD